MSSKNESAPAQEEEKVALFDFLYRDSGRLPSYYSQIFDGRLDAVEETDGSKDVRKKRAKASISIVGGDLQVASEATASSRRTIDPQELITTDTLTYLVEEGFASDDVAAAANGQIVRCHGTVFFLDSHILEMAGVGFDMLLKEEKRKKITAQDLGLIRQIELMKEVIEKIRMPACFFMRTDEGHLVAGTIKEGGMEEPIGTYYYRHGSAGLPNVFLLGIEEVAHDVDMTQTDLLTGAMEMAAGLRGLVFPDDAFRIMPIAMFRSLG